MVSIESESLFDSLFVEREKERSASFSFFPSSVFPFASHTHTHTHARNGVRARRRLGLCRVRELCPPRLPLPQGGRGTGGR